MFVAGCVTPGSGSGGGQSRTLDAAGWLCVLNTVRLHRGCKQTLRVLLLTRCVLLLLLHNCRATQVMVIGLLMLTLSLVPYLTGQLMDALTSTSTYQRRR